MANLSIFELTNKKAIVTGAGRGIGKAVAIALANAGADVIVCARTLEDIVETSNEIEKLGRKGVPIQADVRNEENVQSLFKQAHDKLGSMDIVVNNAGVPSWQTSWIFQRADGMPL